jgi:hypothetical protein
MSILDKLRTRYKVRCRICNHFDADMTTVHEVMDEAASTIELLQHELDRMQLAYIEATNPGIDMHSVRRLRGCGPECSEHHTYTAPCVLDGDAQIMEAARASNREQAAAVEQRMLDAMRSPDA